MPLIRPRSPITGSGQPASATPQTPTAPRVVVQAEAPPAPAGGYTWSRGGVDALAARTAPAAIASAEAPPSPAGESKTARGGVDSASLIPRSVPTCIALTEFPPAPPGNWATARGGVDSLSLVGRAVPYTLAQAEPPPIPPGTWRTARGGVDTPATFRVIPPVLARAEAPPPHPGAVHHRNTRWLLRTGTLLQTFPGQAAASWSEAELLAIQTIAGVDYLLIGGTCDLTGNYLGGGGAFAGTNFDWVIMRVRADTGEIDRTFGTYGSWQLQMGSDDDEIGGVAVDSSNRIVLTGVRWDSLRPQQSLRLIRLLSDGDQDTNFGSYGTAEFFVETARYQCSNVAHQSTGKIVSYTNAVSGGLHRSRLARHHPNGALDTGFGQGSGPVAYNGWLQIQPGNFDTEASDYYGPVLVDGSDRLYISGRYDHAGTGNYQGFVARVLADGHATDTTFGAQVGATGVWLAVVDFSQNNGNLNSIALTAGGGVLACGSALDGSAHEAGAVALLDSSGALDTSFNTTGILEVHKSPTLVSEYWLQPVVTSGGAFRFFGMSASISASIADTVSPTARHLSTGYSASGSLDTSWASSGVYENASQSLGTLFQALAWTGGKVFAAGHQEYPATTVAQACVLRFGSAGALDPTWGDLANPPAAPTAPTCVTLNATLVASTTATLNGTVNPNGTDTTYHFEYGLTVNCLQKTAETGAGSGSAAVPVSASLTGLLPGLLYYCRLVAFNGAVGLSATEGSFITTAGTLTPLQDSFTNTDGTDLRDHTGHAQVDLTGTAYRQILGTGSIEGNLARFDSDSGSGAGNKKWMVHRDVGFADVTVTGTFTFNGGNDGNDLITGLVVRATTQAEGGGGVADHYLAAGFQGSTFVIRKEELGGAIVDSISFTRSNGVPYTVSVTVQGQNITASVTGGSRSLSGAIGAPTLSTNTNVGWFCNKGFGDTIGDFSVTTESSFAVVLPRARLSQAEAPPPYPGLVVRARGGVDSLSTVPRATPSVLARAEPPAPFPGLVVYLAWMPQTLAPAFPGPAVWARAEVPPPYPGSTASTHAPLSTGTAQTPAARPWLFASESPHPERGRSTWRPALLAPTTPALVVLVQAEAPAPYPGANQKSSSRAPVPLSIPTASVVLARAEAPPPYPGTTTHALGGVASIAAVADRPRVLIVQTEMVPDIMWAAAGMVLAHAGIASGVVLLGDAPGWSYGDRSRAWRYGDRGRTFWGES